MRSKVSLAILGIIALALVAAGCGTGKPSDASSTTPASSSTTTTTAENNGGAPAGEGDPEKGRTVYSNCSACHGANGEGVIGPAFIANGKVVTGATGDGTKAVSERLTEADHIKIVTDGRPDKGMPAWKGTLSDQQIADVVAYEREYLAEGKQ